MIDWILNQDRTPGVRARLRHKLDYLWRSCTGELSEQNDLFCLTFRISVGFSVLIWQYYTGAEVLVPSVSQGAVPGWFSPLPCYSGDTALTASSRRRMMVCREVPNWRATALILAPAFSCSSATCCCSGFSAGGRPNRFPAALALARQECVRSISRSFSNSATAENAFTVPLLPACMNRGREKSPAPSV